MKFWTPRAAKSGWNRLLHWRRRRRTPACRQCLVSWQGGLGYAVVGQKDGRIRLNRAGWLPDPLPEALPLRRDDDTACSIVVPFTDYRLLNLEPPQVPQEELAQAVRWIVASRLPTEPIEALTVDFIQLDPRITAGRPELLAVVAHNDVLQRHLHHAWRSSLRPDAIDIPEMAQRNLAHLSGSKDDLTMLALTPMGGLFTVTRQGELCFSRHLEYDWSRLTGHDAMAAQEQMDRLVLELQRSLDYIERHHTAWRIDVIHLAATLPPSRLGQIADGVNVPCLPFELRRWIDGADDLDPDTLAHVWFALGGALRGLMGGA